MYSVSPSSEAALLKSWYFCGLRSLHSQSLASFARLGSLITGLFIEVLVHPLMRIIVRVSQEGIVCVLDIVQNQ